MEKLGVRMSQVRTWLFQRWYMLRRLKTPLRYMNKTLPNTLSCNTGRRKAFKTWFFMSIFTLRDSCQRIKAIPVLNSLFLSLLPLFPSISLSLSFLLFLLFFNRTPQNGARMRGKRQTEKHELEACWVPLPPVYMGPYTSTALPPGPSCYQPTCLQGVWLAYFRQGAFPPLTELLILCGKTSSRIYNQI